MRFSIPQPLRPLLLIAVFLLSAGSRLAAQAPTWQDASSPGTGQGESTAIDAVGNTYVTGTFSGTITFGATTLTSAGAYDIFVAKRTPTGAWQWATSAGGSGPDEGAGVTVDASGNVVVIGYFASPTITFGATTLTNAGGQDIFVAKLTPAGAWQWATSAGGNASDNSTSVAVDSSGSVVVTGNFASPTIAFGATTLTNMGGQDIFIAKLTPTGAWQWATSAGGNAGDNSTSVAVDSSGNVVVTGFFTSPAITLGATTLTSNGAYNVYVAKLTPTGAWQWATSAGGSGNNYSYGVAVDGNGNVVITGIFTGPTIAFGATTLTNVGGQDIFVAKLTPAGAWQWAAGAGGSASEIGYAVAVDGSGSVVVTGSFGSPTITFGSTTLTSAGSYDIFVAKLTPLGAWQWATSAGGANVEGGNDLALDGSGNVVVTGYFQSPTITFGATTLSKNPASPGPALFLARLSGTTGLPESSGDQPQLTLAPNPARTTVQLTGATGPTATLLDGLGRVVGTAAVTPAGGATLDVRALPAGLYLLRAGGRARRLVVE